MNFNERRLFRSFCRGPIHFGFAGNQFDDDRDDDNANDEDMPPMLVLADTLMTEMTQTRTCR